MQGFDETVFGEFYNTRLADIGASPLIVMGGLSRMWLTRRSHFLTTTSSKKTTAQSSSAEQSMKRLQVALSVSACNFVIRPRTRPLRILDRAANNILENSSKAAAALIIARALAGTGVLSRPATAGYKMKLSSAR
jgi:hypothetical protein